MRQDIRGIARDIAPGWIKDGYHRAQQWAGLDPVPYRLELIDLNRVLVGGEGRFTAEQWAELVGDYQQAPVPLSQSPHVEFFERQRRVGDKILERDQFEQTRYYARAMDCIRYVGSLFGATTPEEVRDQARAFVRLYEHIRDHDPTPVRFPCMLDHAAFGTPPVLLRTGTPGMLQIVDGHHRLAIHWVLGHRRVQAAVGPAVAHEPQRR